MWRLEVIKRIMVRKENHESHDISTLVCCLVLDWLLLVAGTESPNRVHKMLRRQSHQKKSYKIVSMFTFGQRHGDVTVL